MKVLIAEDNNVSRRLLQKNLEKWGYEVVCTKDGEEALENFKEEQFPLIVTDWMMPKMNGVELVKQVRAIQKIAYVYIIMLTARTDKYDLIEGMEAGADDFVNKPFDPDELRVRLLAGERLLHLEQRLFEQNKELNESNRRMRESLEAAAKIQLSLLPAVPPPLKDLNIEWRFKPCEELAGDTFNIFSLDENHIGLYLLDVSGHGVPAALLATTLSRLLSPVSDEASMVRTRDMNNPLQRITAPREVANQLNKRFQLEAEGGQYFTLIYGILNIQTKEMRYISAGHPHIICVSNKREPRVLKIPGMPIGFMEDYEYEEHTLTLQPGDRIYLYSDGIPESYNRYNEQFGVPRMVESLIQRLNQPLRDSVEALLGEASAWCSPRDIGDDVSILALEMLA